MIGGIEETSAIIRSPLRASVLPADPHRPPRPCVWRRKDGDEAAVGRGIGQPLSRGCAGRPGQEVAVQVLTSEGVRSNAAPVMRGTRL